MGPAWLPTDWSRLPDTWRCQITGICAGPLDTGAVTHLGLPDLWGSQILHLSPASGAAGSLGQVDDGAFRLLKATKLPGQADPGVFGHPGLLDPWSYWNHRSDRSQGCCASRAAGFQIQPEPATAGPPGQSKPGALGHPRLSNPWSCWIPGDPDPGDRQTAGDSRGSAASKPP